MIIKFVKRGGAELTLQCDGVYQQPLANLGTDVEVTTGSATKRFVLRDEPVGDEWRRAYIVENGKTVDTIRPSVAPISPPHTDPNETQAKHALRFG